MSKLGIQYIHGKSCDEVREQLAAKDARIEQLEAEVKRLHDDYQGLVKRAEKLENALRHIEFNTSDSSVVGHPLISCRECEETNLACSEALADVSSERVAAGDKTDADGHRKPLKKLSNLLKESGLKAYICLNRLAKMQGKLGANCDCPECADKTEGDV